MLTKISEGMLPRLGSFTGEDIPDNPTISEAFAAVEQSISARASIETPDFIGPVTVNGVAIETRAARGVANGYAALGADGKIPSVNLPDNGSYKGNWDASTNTPTIVAGVGTNGDTYTVSTAGTQSVTGSSVAFTVGDQLRYTTNGNKWERIPNSQLVSSVAGLIGTISPSALKTSLALGKADVGLMNVDNTTDLNKPISTAVQAALSLKASTSLSTRTAGGLMSATDKIKVDDIPSVAILNSAIVGQPINLLDHCTDDAQRTAVLSGDVGIDIPMNAALIAAGIQGRPIFIPGRGKYKTTPNAIIQNTLGVSILGEGCTIKKVGNGPLFRTGPTSDPVMGGARLIDGTLAAGTKVVKVRPGHQAQFSVGQWVIVTDRTRIFPIANNCRGEIQLIQNIAEEEITGNGLITFWAPTKYDYLGGDVGSGYARIVAAPLISNTIYRDFNVEMDDTVDPTTSGESHAFENRWLLNPRFENIRISKFVKIGLYFRACVGWSATNVHFSVGGSSDKGSADPTSDEGLGGFSYGVCEAGPCIGGRMSNCTSVNIRHTYTTVSLAPNNGNVVDYGEPVGSVISNCTAIYSVNAAFDTHESGWNISFYNNKVIGGHFVGMQIRSRGTTVNGLEVIDTVGSALWIRGGATTPNDNAYASDVVWDNVIARNTNSGVTFDTSDWRERGAVCDEARNSRGGTLYAFDVGGPAITFYRNGGNQGGYVNRIVARNVCKFATTNKFVAHVPMAFTGDVYINDIFSVSEDNKVTNTICGTGSVGTIRNISMTTSGHTGANVVLSGGMTFGIQNSTAAFPSDPLTWKTPTLSNGWTVYTTGGQSAPKYRLNPAGQVVLKGHGTAGSIGSTAFILPAGYRPPELMRFNACTAFGTCIITIESSGAVIITSPAVNSGARYFSLDGIILDVTV